MKEYFNKKSNDLDYKKLPCFNIISTGFCPYNNLCSFIHDKKFMIESKNHHKITKNRPSGKMTVSDRHIFDFAPLNAPNKWEYNPKIESLTDAQKAGYSLLNDLVKNLEANKLLEEIEYFQSEEFKIT